MSIRQSRIILFLAVGALSASADTLVLRSGGSVSGSYLGGTPREIRMDVNGKTETYAVDQVSQVLFENGPAPVTAARQDEFQLSSRRSENGDFSSRPARMQLPAGATITVRMIDDVDSEQARLGQTFRASIDEPISIDGSVVVPRNADAVAKLVSDEKSGKLAGRTVLTLALMQIQVNGRMVDVATGDVSTASSSRTGRSAKVIGGTTALGAAIGAIAGGGSGAAIGAASGAAVGTGAQVMTKGQRVQIPSESRLTFTLTAPVEL